ncbi:MAG: efflux RND transporter permease subunit [Polyangiaceae bacterium]|nr:efflux RND transporter permease subunit [Polyangiaceae bacterium]MCE7889360.1 efflux RND transporter permease subunit [Sorangiineae bacterium PRO1]MCL4752695.1 efflux RND transporter permease subunit [Myxococcales bacterium]
MQWLSNVSVRRPVFATVLVLVIAVLGTAGYFQLGVDRFPKVDFPTVVVVTRLPGAAPAEIETEVSDKLEEAVNTISGIDELRSISSEGVSQVIVTFVLEKDVDVAAQEVRERVNTALGNLPSGTEAPVVMKFDADATPVLYVAVNAPAPLGEITEVADKTVRRRIESVRGVGQVNVLGGTKRQVNVVLDAERLRAHGLTAIDVQRAISGGNLTVPGGRIEAGPDQKVLRVRGRVQSPAEVAELVLRDQGGQRVTVGDVAKVEDGVESAETAALRDGKPAVLLSIRKQSGENSVAMADEVRARLDEIRPGLPAGYGLEVIRDNTATIRASVGAVKEHLLLGALFAGAVVLIFLGSVRSTLIAAVAIPVSIVGTFALMWWQGFSLDTITLLALALAVGIVIDDAIVVLENIHRHIQEKQLSPVKAAVVATKEIGLAVLATTLSLVAVFLPVAFMSGIVGRFLKSFGLTMAFSIMVSMLVSFTLTPMLSSRWLGRARPHAAGRGAKQPVLERIVDTLYAPVERAYVRLLSWVMRRRWVVVAASLVTLASTVPLLAKVPKGFLPRSDDAQFEVNVRAPEGQSLEATALTAERIARQVRELPHVTSTVVTIGDSNDKTPNLAKVFVKLTDPETRELSQDELMAMARREIVPNQPKDLRIDVSDVPMFAGGGAWAAIQYEISGPDLAELERLSAQIVARVKKVPGAVDVTSTHVTGKPELALRVDRSKAADLGVSVADVAATLRLFVGGQEVSSYEEDGQTYGVFVRGVPIQRADLDGLSQLGVPSSKLGNVPLLDVVESSDGAGPASITRLNRKRQVMFLANLAPGAAQSEVMAGVEAEIAALDLPPEYKVAAVGQSREMQRTAQGFLVAFLLSFVFMYLVLAAQFESWLHPITILLALPLTLPFALVSLLLFRQALDIYSMLGLLVLFGVVKKNSILQIDHTNQLRREGKDRLEAILVANRDRLRPILMTTLAFVAGMLPLAFSTGIGAGMNRATAGVIVGGQVLSLLLTLLATPVAYSLLDDLSAWLRRRFAASPERAERERELAELEREMETGTAPVLSSPTP